MDSNPARPTKESPHPTTCTCGALEPGDLAAVRQAVAALVGTVQLAGHQHNHPQPDSERLDTVERALLVVAMRLADLEGVRPEVRTRRLVVEDEHGFERVVAEAGDKYGCLAVRCERDAKEGASAELYAGEQGPEMAMLHLGDGSQAVGTFQVRRLDDLPDDLPYADLRHQFHVEVNIHDDDGYAALAVDSEGVKAHPMRVYAERRRHADDRQEIAAGRIQHA